MNLPPGKPIHLRILSEPVHLPVVRAAMEKACELCGLDAQAAGGVVLSVDEALTNIIKHAYGCAADRPIEIELAVLDPPPARRLLVRVRDYGCHVDPARIKPRDLADVRPGGLGVHIIKQCMDSVEYQKADGGGTLLTMLKDLPDQEERGTSA